VPASRRPFTIFWTAVLFDVLALGVAWSAWKATGPLALVVAIPATFACAAATLVAGRVLVVVSRAAPRRIPTRRSP
jgi:hypothetical protein